MKTTPPISSLNPEHLPEELRREPFFTSWYWKGENGNWTKPPCESVTDPTTFCTLEAALARQSPRRGVGFVFAVGLQNGHGKIENDYCGVDLDHCRDPQTGAIEPWARDIIDRLASYAEVSPSGTGVHVIIKARLPDNSLHKRTRLGPKGEGALEIYDRDRYFTLTGHPVPLTPSTVEGRQDEVEKLLAEYRPAHRDAAGVADEPSTLTDEEVVGCARTARSKDRFERLYGKGELGKSGDHSASVFELIKLLIEAGTREIAQIERIVAASALITTHGRTDDWKERGHYHVKRALQRHQPKGTGEALTVRIAAAILSNYIFAKDAGGWLHVFLDGVYQRTGEELVLEQVKRILTPATDKNEQWTVHRAKEVVAYIRTGLRQLWDAPPLDVVNVKNGLLHLPTRTLREHTPDHLTSVQLPIIYDPSAGCPEWDKFIGGDPATGRPATLPQDVIEAGIHIEPFARCMTPDTSSPVIELLVGAGGNGKSVYNDGLTAFLGHANVSALALHSIAERFAASELVGKLANICSDIPSQQIHNSSLLKQITGGDRIRAEYKYLPGFTFKPFVRLIFSANEMPAFLDSSPALFQRWRVVEFPFEFRNSKFEIPRAELMARLTSERELSGMLNRAIEAWERIQRNKGRMTQSESTKAKLSEFQSRSSMLGRWLVQFTVDDQTCEQWVERSVLLREYNAHRLKISPGAPTVDAKQFKDELLTLKPWLKETQRRDPKQKDARGKAKRLEVWAGIAMRAADKEL